MLVTFSVSTFTARAGGINTSDINTQEQIRQQERQQLLRQQQEIKPDVRDEMDAFKQTPLKASIDIPDSETPCFAINKIENQWGRTRLKNHKLAQNQWSLTPLISLLQGKELRLYCFIQQHWL